MTDTLIEDAKQENRRIAKLIEDDKQETRRMDDKQETRRIEDAEQKVRQAAKRIDPRTAETFWRYGQMLDPYRLGLDLEPEWECLGRLYFLNDPVERVLVLTWEVRALHPDIPDEEWEDLMQDAERRDALRASSAEDDIPY